MATVEPPPDGKTPQFHSPPCGFCGWTKTQDVTPRHFPKIDRLFLCDKCKRRFVVRFVAELSPSGPSKSP